MIKPRSVAVHLLRSIGCYTDVLQRTCACGSPAGPTGECVACRRSRGLGKPLQAKLRINQPGDRFEQEADRVAKQVMRMPESGLQRKPT